MDRKLLWIALVLLALIGGGWWSVRSLPTHDRAAESTELAGAAHTSPSSPDDDVTSATREPAAISTEARSTEPVRRSCALRLIDDRTGEAVPYFDTVVEPGEQALTSDPAGVLRFDAEPDAELRLALAENTRDAPDRIQTRVDAAQATPSIVTARANSELTDVRVPVGPTYRLELLMPPGCDTADLLITLRSADPSQMFDVAYASVRAPAAPWVRFRPTACLMAGGPSWRLAAETRDGLWYGAALVSSNIGVFPELVSLELEPRAALEGTVRDERGAVIGEGLVRIERAGASFSDFSNRPLFGRVGERGTYRIPCVLPGEYTVRFQRETYVPHEERVTLAAGETRTLDLALRRLPARELGRIEGRIVSDSGTFEDALYPFLRPRDSAQSPRNGRVSWSVVEGRKVGSFAFDEVPLGDYVVGLTGPGFRQLEPSELPAHPGDPTLEFRVRDGGERVAFELTAVDEGGTPLTKFFLRLSNDAPGGELVDRTLGRDGRATIEGAPLGRCRYLVRADGRQPVWGEVELTRESRALRVALLPGWGTEVFVRSSDGAPIAGAKVYFDGELLGESDERGELRVALPKAPELARVEHLDWKLSPKSGLSETGRFRTFEPFLNVILEPPTR